MPAILIALPIDGRLYRAALLYVGIPENMLGTLSFTDADIVAGETPTVVCVAGSGSAQLRSVFFLRCS